MTSSVDYGNYMWPEAVANSTTSTSCNRGGGTVSRLCGIDGWKDPDYSQCAGSTGKCKVKNLIKVQQPCIYCNLKELLVIVM